MAPRTPQEAELEDAGKGEMEDAEEASIEMVELVTVPAPPSVVEDLDGKTERQIIMELVSVVTAQERTIAALQRRLDSLPLVQSKDGGKSRTED